MVLGASAGVSQGGRVQNPYDCNMDGARPVFAELIAGARKARGWSQEDLEAASGVSRGTISRWERGINDRPDAENVRAVCRALGIDARQAAFSLGFLTAEEVQGPPASGLDPEIEQVLRLLPDVSPEERRQWIEYLKFLHQRHQQQHKPEQNAS